MPLWSLTKERVDKLRHQIGDKEMEIDALIKLSKEDIWRKDLDDFLAEWRFQLEDEIRRERKNASMGRRASSKLMTGGRVPGAKKKKIAGGDADEDYAVAAPKAKKSAIAKPKGGLLDYLNKSSSTKPPKKPPLDGADEINDDADMPVEILPKKDRGPPKSQPKPPKKPSLDGADGINDDADIAVEILPKKDRGAPKSQQMKEDDIFDSVVIPSSKPPSQTRANRKPVKYTVLSDSESGISDEDFEQEVPPKKSKGTSKLSSEQKEDDIFDAPATSTTSKPASIARKNRKPVKYTISSDSEFEDAGQDSEEVLPKKNRVPPKPKEDSVIGETFATSSSKPTSLSRVNRKPVKYAELIDSDIDSCSDPLDDVTKMVKGIGHANANPSTDTRTLFSERSRPGSSSGLKTGTKASKVASDFDPDETDYTKLVPQQSPRRSLLVKSKDVKVTDEPDDEDDFEFTKPKSRVAATKAKPAASSAKSKPRGRTKKEASN